MALIDVRALAEAYAFGARVRGVTESTVGDEGDYGLGCFENSGKGDALLERTV